MLAVATYSPSRSDAKGAKDDISFRLSLLKKPPFTGFVCHKGDSAVAGSSIPTGLCNKAQGCRATAWLPWGNGTPDLDNLEKVA